jgi:cell division control protein 6
MHSLTRQGQYVLLTVCQLAAEDETPERTKLIYERYREVLRDHGSDPLKHRRVHDHLSDLRLHGILRLVDSSSGRGNYNEYELDGSLSSALDALEGELGELDKIRETAKRHRVLK